MVFKTGGRGRYNQKKMFEFRGSKIVKRSVGKDFFPLETPLPGFLL